MNPDPEKRSAPILLFPDLIPPSDAAAETTDESGIIRGVSIPRIVPFLPPSAKANRTGIIICPGGGYSLLDWRRHVTRAAERLNDRGIAVIGLRYRTSPPNTNVPGDALDDLRRALQITVSMGSDWNIDPDRLVGLGYSAGANLLLRSVSSDKKPQADNEVLRYLALICLWPHGKPAEEYPVSSDPLDVFLCASEEDRTAPVSFSKQMADIMIKAGHSAELKLFDTGGHLSFNLEEDGPENDWIPAFCSWLESKGLL